jgi:hypothetical protein
MKTAVFWVVSPCSLVEVCRFFRGACCLHHRGDESSETLKKIRMEHSLNLLVLQWWCGFTHTNDTAVMMTRWLAHKTFNCPIIRLPMRSLVSWTGLQQELHDSSPSATNSPNAIKVSVHKNSKNRMIFLKEVLKMMFLLMPVYRWARWITRYVLRHPSPAVSIGRASSEWILMSTE